MHVVGDVLAQARQRMEKSLEALRHDLGGVRAGRASPALLDRIRVDYYGTPTPLQQLAGITCPDARTIAVQPWDKSAVSAVEKAILKSDLGLTPQVDGGVLRLPLPQLSAERRAELVRHVRKLAEDQRVVLRNLRREAREQLDRQEKGGGASLDEVKRAGDELQKLTDRYMEQIAEMLAAKEQEITEV
jgi:ribosome recycling factor